MTTSRYRIGVAILVGICLVIEIALMAVNPEARSIIMGLLAATDIAILLLALG